MTDCDEVVVNVLNLAFKSGTTIRELIDHGQALDLLAARDCIKQEVVAPDMVGTECRQRSQP